MAEILLDANPLEVRAARLADGGIRDLRVTSLDGSDAAPADGDLVLGRVRRIDQALQAAFVEIGDARDGYLDASDLRPRQRRPLQRRLQEGQALLLQVRHGALAGKGAGLTMAVQLPGWRLVLTPTDSDLTVSRRIADAAERQRLRAALAGADGGGRDGPGCIVRTIAEGAAADSLQAEYAHLAAQWRELAAAAEAAGPVPRALRAEAPACGALRDWLQPGDAVLALDGAALAQARPWLQAHAPEVPLRLAAPAEAAERGALLDEAVQSALEVRLDLPSGAAISIVETPALTAIDVDSAASGPTPAGIRALRVNLEAVAAIARQMRLRGIGGLLAIDFLRMTDPRQQAEVLDALRTALADDPEAGQVLPFSPLGLVELVRRRRGPSLSQCLLDPAAPQLRPAAAAALALRRLRAEQQALQGRRLRLSCPPEVARLLPPERLQRAGLNAEVAADGTVPRHAPRIGPAG